MNQPKDETSFKLYILIPLAVFCVLLGVKGLIENLSPQHLDNIAQMGIGFWHHIEYHIAIAIGALLFIAGVSQNEK